MYWDYVSIGCKDDKTTIYLCIVAALAISIVAITGIGVVLEEFSNRTQQGKTHTLSRNSNCPTEITTISANLQYSSTETPNT